MTAKKRRVANTVGSRKGKSRRLQNEVCRLVRAATGLEDADITPTPMGVNGIDLQLSTVARSKFPFGVECKNKEQITIWSEMRQCITNADLESLIPLLVFTRNYERCIYTALPTDQFFDLIPDGGEIDAMVVEKSRINIWDLVSTLNELHEGVPVIHLVRNDERYTVLRFIDLLEMVTPRVGGGTSEVE